MIESRRSLSEKRLALVDIRLFFFGIFIVTDVHTGLNITIDVVKHWLGYGGLIIVIVFIVIRNWHIIIVLSHDLVFLSRTGSIFHLYIFRGGCYRRQFLIQRLRGIAALDQCW